MTTVKTDRLVLRPFKDSDLEGYASMSADPDVMRYIGFGRTLTREESWRSMAMLLGHWQLRGYGLWAVELKVTGEFIGRVGLWNPAGWPGLEVGWALCRSAWGQGYATEAAIASVNYAFDVLHQMSVISLIRPENHASIRVAQRLGAVLAGEVELFGATAQQYCIDQPGFLAATMR